MALRVIDIYRSDDETALELPVDTYEVFGHWTFAIDGEKRVDRVLLDVDETENFLDWLDDAMTSEYQVVLQSVEATLPQPDLEDEEETEAEDEDEADVSVARISRSELYEYARGSTEVSDVYYLLVALSMVVAAGGMIRDQTAVVIGAMMIAPLIGPNLALALGTTLGDTSLLGRAIWANVSGVALAFSGSLVIGFFIPVDPTTGEMAARTIRGATDVVLAAAAGAAGALSSTRDGRTGLVGVMVAVALLPPLVATGLLIGSGEFSPALHAGLLTVTNVVALNLAAVCTFLALGVWPRDWQDVEQARTSIRIALTLWTVALLVLLVVFWLTG